MESSQNVFKAQQMDLLKFVLPFEELPIFLNLLQVLLKLPAGLSIRFKT